MIKIVFLYVGGLLFLKDRLGIVNYIMYCMEVHKHVVF